MVHQKEIKVNIVDTKGNVGNTELLYVIKRSKPRVYIQKNDGTYIKKSSICPLCGEKVGRLVWIFHNNEKTGWKNEGISCPVCWNVLFYDAKDAQYFLDTNRTPEYLKPDIISKALD